MNLPIYFVSFLTIFFLAEGLGPVQDVFMDQDYGTVEKAVRTYGFIHSKRAIDYIREHSITKIRWKARARFKIVE